ncbi:MAG: hypothetical protein CMM29_10310 [Rhodospirillaceae bacterium]|nr:hypothetical protein [Rhodospirillaceae bacterium]|tara:strand:+ start:1548 stop:1754 length:207 start_codon:yes stop_codon:yes gene_type:complete
MKTLTHCRNRFSETFMFHFGGHGSWARLTAQGAVKLNGRVMGKDEEAHLETGDILKVGRQEWVIGEEE